MTTAKQFNRQQTEILEDRAPKSGSQLLLESIAAQGVDLIFGYPGGAIMPVYDVLPSIPQLRHILCRHEQACGMAAIGYARATGKVGTAFATSGPGATNLVTAIADAYLDSVPVVFVTGQVPTNLMGTDAFQEVDIFGITLPIVKHSYIVRDPADLPGMIAEAYFIAAEGRPGPVLIDLPKDVANAVTTERHKWRPYPKVKPEMGKSSEIEKAEQLIREAKKPLFYIGGGIAQGDGVKELRDLVERTQIPVVSTLKGLGSLPSDHPNYLGMLGMHGLKAANYAVQECDLLIVAGARFDDRATGKLDTFAPHAKVIHMDIDIAEINKLRRVNVGLDGSLKKNLAALDPFDGGAATGINDWLELCYSRRAMHEWDYEGAQETASPGVYAPKLLHDLSRRADDSAIFTCDVGQHQMWVAQHCYFDDPKDHITSGGLGTMGFGLPAGLGAKLGAPERTVITVSGDGSIMMNIQELATLNRYGIPLKIVLLDNSVLGMVRQWQEVFFDKNYSETNLDDNPDFAEVARAFQIEAFTVNTADEMDAGIDRLLSTDGPVLMHVKIDPNENVWPLVPPGRSNADMMER
ncbi:acetolactate synthase large subunit [Litorimonas taeanensis]|uniref:Acetolactate synthase n=1 Tax=Litorimonas taeanensis TaxID=568099 RepID=A0A420WEB0_9PROT|nr:acetolactate synthase 2 catalytic subunit [Litorimonas taeanensis]RKQ69318.1 acetolactate synthase large subunit [Litorimonas taeanensis]